MLDMEATGLQIYKRLDEKGMSVKELAKKIDVYPTAIYPWLRGECIPRFDRMLDIAEVLKCSVYDLVVKI